MRPQNHDCVMKIHKNFFVFLSELHFPRFLHVSLCLRGCPYHCYVPVRFCVREHVLVCVCDNVRVNNIAESDLGVSTTPLCCDLVVTSEMCRWICSLSKIILRKESRSKGEIFGDNLDNLVKLLFKFRCKSYMYILDLKKSLISATLPDLYYIIYSSSSHSHYLSFLSLLSLCYTKAHHIFLTILFLWFYYFCCCHFIVRYSVPFQRCKRKHLYTPHPPTLNLCSLSLIYITLFTVPYLILIISCHSLSVIQKTNTFYCHLISWILFLSSLPFHCQI